MKKSSNSVTVTYFRIICVFFSLSHFYNLEITLYVIGMNKYTSATRGEVQVELPDQHEN